MKNGRVIAVPDCHVPFLAVREWNLALQIIDDQKPSHVVQVGDFLDNMAFSRHGKNFGYVPNPERDLKIAYKRARELDKAARGHITWLEGNHDIWLKKYVAQNAPMVETLIPSLQELIGAEKPLVSYQEAFYIGRVAYVHDVGFAGKHAAGQTLDAVGHCVVFGHTHRGGVVYSGTTSGERWFSLNCGFLGDESKMTYMAQAKRREWQLGIGLIEYRDGLAFAQFIPFVRGKAYVNGKVYKA